MGERLARIAFVNTHPLTRAIVPTLQKVLVLFCACAQGNKERAGLQNLAGKLADQVVALLRYQPRNYRDDWALGLFRQTKAAQQLKFASQFAGEVDGGEIRRNFGICFRVPKIVVNAIGDTGQPIAASSQKPVKAGPVFRCLDLLGITMADGGQGVGSDESRFQGGGHAFEDEIVFVGRLAKTQPPEIARIKRALIRQIVNRKERLDSAKEFVVTAARAKFHHGKSAGPVVAMNDIGLPVKMFD